MNAYIIYKHNRNNKNMKPSTSVAPFKLSKCGEYGYWEGCWPRLISFKWSYLVCLNSLLNYDLYQTLRELHLQARDYDNELMNTTKKSLQASYIKIGLPMRPDLKNTEPVQYYMQPECKNSGTFNWVTLPHNYKHNIINSGIQAYITDR